MASMWTCFIFPHTRPKPLLTQTHPFSLLPHPTRFLKRESLIFRASSGGGGAAEVVSTEGEMMRPGGVIETDRLPADVRRRVMDAVDSFGGRVTVGDVAGKAGLKVSLAQKALQALAADTSGFLEVSDEGDVLYVFEKDYRSKLAGKSLRLKIEPLIEKAKSAGEYVVRVSFGTALIASIVIVYTAILALISSSRDEDNRGRRGGRSFDSGFSFYLRPSDLFWYWDPYYYRRRQSRVESDGMNFIESVFSFVFGDGDPNLGLEEKRWKLIGEYIATNGGVVTAEELAPYLDIETTNTMDDDSYILPVLLRFDGQPEVNEEGNILYKFPSLQRTASPRGRGRKEYVGKKWADFVGGVEKSFNENRWEFSKASMSERAMVIGLGAFNLFGVITLGTMLKNTTVTPAGFLTFVSDIFPLLQIYAGSFFAIPLVRWFIVSKTNKEIEKRNFAREIRARALELPDPPLRRKLSSARDMAQRISIGQDRIVYSTENDKYEKEFETQEWDRRFQEIEKSE